MFIYCLKSAVDFDPFLTSHGGVMAFFFREYENGNLIKVVCPKWSKTVTKRHKSAAPLKKWCSF